MIILVCCAIIIAIIYPAFRCTALCVCVVRARFFCLFRIYCNFYYSNFGDWREKENVLWQIIRSRARARVCNAPLAIANAKHHDKYSHSQLTLTYPRTHMAHRNEYVSRIRRRRRGRRQLRCRWMEREREGGREKKHAQQNNMNIRIQIQSFSSTMRALFLR